MIVVLLALILVGLALWYLVFIVFARPRRTRNFTRRPKLANPPPAAALDVPVHPASLGWSALDDQQLTRLLKGSAPSP